MQKFLFGILLGTSIAASTGCMVPLYSGDPQRRTQELINSSENLRLFLDDWERAWLLDQPSHLTPFVTHGGII
jgi:hypothetical protein